ncbi:hypothetical protein DAMA08_020570 [Martiniozyma asiatica (nom. inval.)]|nr:hypothetical protein DAMA08_020570 [Martiniozyma asiatica]
MNFYVLQNTKRPPSLDAKPQLSNIKHTSNGILKPPMELVSPGLPTPLLTKIGLRQLSYKGIEVYPLQSIEELFSQQYQSQSHYSPSRSSNSVKSPCLNKLKPVGTTQTITANETKKPTIKTSTSLSESTNSKKLKSINSLLFSKSEGARINGHFDRSIVLFTQCHISRLVEILLQEGNSNLEDLIGYYSRANARAIGTLKNYERDCSVYMQTALYIHHILLGAAFNKIHQLTEVLIEEAITFDQFTNLPFLWERKKNAKDRSSFHFSAADEIYSLKDLSVKFPQLWQKQLQMRNDNLVLPGKKNKNKSNLENISSISWWNIVGFEELPRGRGYRLPINQNLNMSETLNAVSWLLVECVSANKNSTNIQNKDVIFLL